MELRKENRMGTEKMFKLIVSMSVPSMFSMLIQALYNIVDGIFVSHYSHIALQAVNLAFPLQMLIVSVGVGTSVGVNSLVSRSLGAKKFDEANSAATHGILLAVFSWILFLVLGLSIVKPFAYAMSAGEEATKQCITYLTIVMVASIGSFIQLTCEKILQATGNMIYPMIFHLTGAVVNIIFDPLLIFGIGFFPEMGVAGAAFATVAGQIVAAIFALSVLLIKKHEVKVTFKDFKFSGSVIGNIYKVGVPSIIMQAIGSVLTSLLNVLLMGLEKTGVAVNVFGIYFKIQSFVFMPVFGLTHGLMPIMGYSYGARNKKRLLSALKIGMLLGACIMFFGTVLFMAFPDALLGLFNADAKMLEYGVVALRVISLCFVFAAIGIISSTMFQALGNGIYSLIISLLRQIVLLLPIAYMLSGIMGVNGVWWAFPIAELGGLVAGIVFLAHIYKTRIREL